MKNRVSFLIITSGTGKQRRFSISRYFLYCVFFLCVVLFSVGVFGAWKFRENIDLNRKYLQLEAERVQLESVARNLEDIKAEESTVRDLLGIENVTLKDENE